MAACDIRFRMGQKRKLTPTQEKKIHAAYHAPRPPTLTELALRYKVGVATIYNIVKREPPRPTRLAQADGSAEERQ